MKEENGRERRVWVMELIGHIIYMHCPDDVCTLVVFLPVFKLVGLEIDMTKGLVGRGSLYPRIMQMRVNFTYKFLSIHHSYPYLLAVGWTGTRVTHKVIFFIYPYICIFS